MEGNSATIVKSFVPKEEREKKTKCSVKGRFSKILPLFVKEKRRVPTKGRK